MATSRLKLTRAQLAAFLKDPESIRQFEKLFAVADSDIPGITILIEEAQIAAGSALASAVQALDSVEALRTAVELAALAPPRPPEMRRRKGQFASTVTQTAAATATAYPITFNVSQMSEGVEIGSPASRIVVDTEGLYAAAATIQTEKTSAGAGSLYAWWRVNGVDVANSARLLVVNGTDADGPLSLSAIFSLKAGDYVEAVWEVDSTAVQLPATAASGVHPAGASAQLSLWAL